MTLTTGIQILLVIPVLGGSVFCLLCVWAVKRFLGRVPEPSVFRPPVTVLKPLYGLDKQLEQNLRTSLTPPLPAFAKTVIVVDDGLATGATMKAALKALLLQKPHKILVAVPVGPEDTCSEIEEMGYEIVCPKRLPSGELSSVGEWYDDFSQVESGT